MCGKSGKKGLMLLAAAVLLPAGDRRQELEDLLRILPRTRTNITGRITAQDKSWEDWVRRTGELPPDFDEMPSSPQLPGVRWAKSRRVCVIPRARR